MGRQRDVCYFTNINEEEKECIVLMQEVRKSGGKIDVYNV